MIKIFIILILISLLNNSMVFAQQYCIDVGAFNDWLCRNAKGAQAACYAQRIHGPFPDYNSCEMKRRSTLSNNFHFQQMTRCVPCGPSSPAPSRPSPPQESPQERTRKEIELKVANMKNTLKSMGCSQAEISWVEKLPSSTYDPDPKIWHYLVDFNFKIAKMQCEKKLHTAKLLEREERERREVQEKKQALLLKWKGISPTIITSKRPSPNPILINLNNSQALIDGTSPEVLKKIADWYKDEAKSPVLDWLSEKTNLPLDKFDKALSVGGLISESVIQPVFNFLEEVKVALRDPGKWQQLAERSQRVVTEADQEITMEAKKTVAREYIEGIPKVGGLLGKFFSAGATSYEILEENK